MARLALPDEITDARGRDRCHTCDSPASECICGLPTSGCPVETSNEGDQHGWRPLAEGQQSFGITEVKVWVCEDRGAVVYVPQRKDNLKGSEHGTIYDDGPPRYRQA